MKPNMKIFDDMKKIFICIALIAISSCTIKDYEKDGYSFNNYMRNVALRYILDAADALEYMRSADEIINGGGDTSNYKKIGVNKWEVGYNDTLSTNGLSFMQAGARWSLSRDFYSRTNHGIYSFVRTERGWEGSFTEEMDPRAYWSDIINDFSCTTEIKVVAASDEMILTDGYIFHISGKRTEDDYKMEFCTSVEGATSQNGTVLIKTFRDGELLHSGTVSYDENDQWTYGE